MRAIAGPKAGGGELGGREPHRYTLPGEKLVASPDSHRRARLLEGVDLRKLPLTPQEAFILSRVDGTATDAEIALATGLDPAVIHTALEKFAQLGAIAFVEPEAARPPKGAVATPAQNVRIGAVIETRADGGERHPAAALYDPAELDETVDIDLPRKRRILDAYYRIDRLSHYEVLGVAQNADKKAVKTAYFEVVNLFHPDRYFGKNLGSFKSKLERLFARVTEAHDVLTRQAAREEYDRYLASVNRTQALDRTLSESASAREAERVEREIIEQAQLEDKAQHSYPPPASFAPGAPPITTSSMPPRPSDPELRRRALARKLGRSLPPRAAAEPEGPVSTPVSREALADELRRRHEERVAELKARQVERYVVAADEAERAKDLVSATNALRIATTLRPEDPSLLNRLKELELKAASGLSEGYLEQAAYEERERRFAEAAASYERAARGRPTPKVHERVAFCLLEAGLDLKKAADFAKRARDGAPDDAQIRVTLGRIYLEAGMKQSAVTEFERAQQLSPRDDTIKDWLRRSRRSEA
jgi:curved DNA-binding protein CbpA